MAKGLMVISDPGKEKWAVVVRPVGIYPTKRG